jgi:hypothetical protein
MKVGSLAVQQTAGNGFTTETTETAERTEGEAASLRAAEVSYEAAKPQRSSVNKRVIASGTTAGGRPHRQ